MNLYAEMTDKELASCLIDSYRKGEIPHDYAVVEAACRLATTATRRPEPSRLEIAAMMAQGMLACTNRGVDTIANRSLKFADALLAAAKGGE